MPPNRNIQTNMLSGMLAGIGSVSDWSAAQNTVGQQLMGLYTQAGMSKAGAAGTIGNQMQESSLDPSSAGGGLSQWIGDRYSSLVTYAKSLGESVNSVKAQAGFTVRELQAGYPALWKMLTTTKDPAAAALAISNQYERPNAAAANNAARQRYAAEAFGGLAGTAPAAGGNGGDGGGGGGFTVLQALTDFLTGNFTELGGQIGLLAFSLVKDGAIALGDLLIVPWWHWNQRAVMYYYIRLMSVDSENLYVGPATAGFWGIGYWLLFKDPEQKGLAPVPVHQSRLARHIRKLQGVPARKSLVKPRDVAKRTPKKPKPVISRAVITQTGTLKATRTERVTISGSHRSPVTGETSTVGREPQGTVRAHPQGEAQAPHATHTLPDAGNRAGTRSLPRRGGDTGVSETAGGRRRRST